MVEDQNIENLKRVLRNLEIETEATRKQLQKLLHNNEARRCQVEISWNSSSQLYLTRFLRNGDLLHSYNTKKYSRNMASMGIELANGLRPRVSWKDIDAGKTWSADAIIHEWYWDKYLASKAASFARVIDLNIFRAVQRK